ncbi:MAG: hypothetical protein L0L39_00330, partial [Atopostipes suicloacalis]|nr:hypothetical protein [Atopostipes suicloacalis]
MKSLFYGRELLLEELPETVKESYKKKELKVEKRKSFFIEKGKIFCRRCQTEMTATNKHECICGKECAYCRNCLKMGKVR